MNAISEDHVRLAEENASLRRQVLTLTEELGRQVARTRAVHGQRRRDSASQPRRCYYCGAPCAGLTCRSHADLLHVDPLHAR